MTQLQAWRTEARANSSYPSKWYDEKGLAWARTSFLQREIIIAHARLVTCSGRYTD